MKPEANLYKRIKENLENCTITKIENRGELGVPDLIVGFTNPCRFVLVELKVVSSGNKVRFSPHQISFQMRHKKYPVYTVVQHKDNILLYKADSILHLVDKGLKHEPLFSCELNRMQWQMFRHYLIYN